jgi:hypothetical protein
MWDIVQEAISLFFSFLFFLSPRFYGFELCWSFSFILFRISFALMLFFWGEGVVCMVGYRI